MLEKNNITIPTINNLLFNNPLSDHIKNLENLEKSMSIVLECNKIMTESYNLLENTSNLFHNLENISSIFKLSSKIQEPLFFSLSLVSDIQILEHNNLIETIKKLEPSITIPKFPIVSLHENFSKDELEKNEVLNQNKLLIERIEFLLSQLKDKDELINQKDITINEKNIIINTQKEIIFYYQKKLHSKDNIISLKNELHYYLQEEFSQQSQENEILKSESKRKNEYFDKYYLKNKSFNSLNSEKEHNNKNNQNLILSSPIFSKIKKIFKLIILICFNKYSLYEQPTEEQILEAQKSITRKNVLKNTNIIKSSVDNNYILSTNDALVLCNVVDKTINSYFEKIYFTNYSKSPKYLLFHNKKGGRGNQFYLVKNLSLEF